MLGVCVLPRQTHATMPGAPEALAAGMQASLNAAEVQGASPEEPSDPETARARVSVEGTALVC